MCHSAPDSSVQLLITSGLLQRLVQAIILITLRQHVKNCRGVRRRNNVPVDSRRVCCGVAGCLVTVQEENKGKVSLCSAWLDLEGEVQL